MSTEAAKHTPCLIFHSDDGHRSWMDAGESCVKIARGDAEKQDAIEAAEEATAGDVRPVFVPVLQAFAAPDLLDTCQQVERWMSDFTPGNPLLDRVRHVIRKATGGAA